MACRNGRLHGLQWLPESKAVSQIQKSNLGIQNFRQPNLKAASVSNSRCSHQNIAAAILLF